MITFSERTVAKEISSIDQEPPFLLFLDHRNAFDTVDRDRLFITLEGCGVGPLVYGLLETF